MCKARKGVKDLPIFTQGLPAVFLADLPAVRLADLSAVIFIRRISCLPFLWRIGGVF